MQVTNADRVFEYLDARGVKARWLADQLGVHESVVSRIRHGRRPVPSWFVERVPDVLGQPRDVLFPELSDTTPERDAAAA